MFIKLHITLVVLCFFFANGNLSSQVTDSLFDLSCQHEDLIILNEELDMNIVGQKIDFMQAYVTHNLTYIIRTKGGKAEFQPFTLPHKFDELFIYHGPTVRNIDWDYDKVNIQNFNANILTGNNQERQVLIDKKLKKKRVLDETGFFGHTIQYEYFLKDLKEGDTIQISYTYEITFRGNWFKMLSNRILFNGKYPKKNYKLNWCYNINLTVDSQFVHHDIPEITIDGSKLCYHWNLQNLPGCLDESGARPYRTLPHFIFVPKPFDIEYTHHDSYKQEFIPIYYIEANKRQMDLNSEKWDVVIGNKNKNNLHYQKVASHIISQAPDDTIGEIRMRYLQRYLVDSTNYDPALEYYKHNEDHRKQRAGVDLWGHKLSDNNLERIYGNLVPRLGMNLLTAYPIDKRVGEISRLYNSTVKDNDLIFAVLLNNLTFGLVIPRSDKNNYYFGEVPFYYEEIPVMIMDVSDFINRSQLGGKRNYNQVFQKWMTPITSWEDNYRKVQSKVSINLEDNKAEFQTRVILSGQYSTLTRFVYIDKPIDSTINPKYHEPIWNVADDIKITKVKTTQPLIYSPFKITVMSEYNSNSLISFDNNQYKLKLGNWFKMIYNDDILETTRFLDYYPDFIGSDSYSYMVEFDKPINLVSIPDTFDINNKYCHFSLSFKQIDKQRILFNCTYNILSKRIEKDSIGLVKEINQQIIKLKQSEIKFEIVD